MFEFKPLSKEAIPAALAKADQYRLLNEPREAESICRDVLRAEPEHQEALIKLLLSLTDQFKEGSVKIAAAQKVLGQLQGEYERYYYEGVIFERWAKAQHRQGVPNSVASEWLLEAMLAFEKAEAIRPPGNDDALLRWNCCVRIIRADEYLRNKFANLSLGSKGAIRGGS
jgi:hypothetical protein